MDVEPKSPTRDPYWDPWEKKIKWEPKFKPDPFKKEPKWAHPGLPALTMPTNTNACTATATTAWGYPGWVKAPAGPNTVF